MVPKVDPSDEFQRLYHCAPLPLLWKPPAGYVACNTGPLALTVDIGTGLSGKGSFTKAKLSTPSWIRPLPKDQLDKIKDWASVEDCVAVGNGRDVLVVSEYKDANCSTEAWKAAASVIGEVKSHST